MYEGIYVQLFVLSAVWVDATDALKCYSCSNIRNVSDCLTVTRCAGDEECYTDATGLGHNTIYNLGCRTTAQCQGAATTQSSVSIIGRHIDTRSGPTDCSQCCAVDSCNEKLCSRTIGIITNTNGSCHDDPDYNCELVSGLFNVCSDIHHAKVACRKWCGLCDLVDGGWSSWSLWSSCDHTCGLGRNTRYRTCTAPTPSHGGLECLGSKDEYSNCTITECPVHGGWSSWTAWGECSVTCSVGLQRRDRSCTNPYPGPGGNHCFGDARDDRVCFLRACADGNWSGWTQWDTCTATCNGGMMTRQRTCDNPSPSMFGKSCVGNSDENVLCNTDACPNIDGGWSEWSAWSGCSATCNGGLKSRSRSCNNPTPTKFGKLCDGNNEDKDICKTQSCPAPVVIFSVTNPSATLVVGSTSGVPRFPTILTNIGNGYNTSSGEFKCVVPGTYQFSLSFMSYSGSSHCYIQHNKQYIVYASTEHYSSSSYWSSATTSTYLTLAVTDVVNPYCYGWNTVHHGDTAVFNGALVAPH